MPPDETRPQQRTLEDNSRNVYDIAIILFGVSCRYLVSNMVENVNFG